MTKRKRVLLYMAKVDVGGVENLFLNIIPLLSEHFEFRIAYYGEGPNELGEQFEAIGCDLVRINADRFRHPMRFISELRACMREGEVEILHANAGYSTFFALVAAYLERVPIRIAHSHSSVFGLRGNPFNLAFEFLCKLSCHFLATERVNIGSKSSTAIFFANDSSVFVPNGIELGRFVYKCDARRRVRRDLGIEEDAFVVLHVGRFVPVKNHEFLIDVFAELLKLIPNAVLVMVGDGPLRDEALGRVNDLGILGKVRFSGIVDNTEDYYSAADVFVFPSIYEGLSLSLVEAQASGLPCFTSEAVDRDTKVTDLLTFLPLGDEAEWARAIEERQEKRKGVSMTPELEEFDCHQTASIIESLYCGRSRK